MDPEEGTVRIAAAAKLNLRLHVVGVRPDGYHLLDSIMVPVGIFDHLEVAAQPGTKRKITLECSNDQLPGGGENLAVRAAHLYLVKTGIDATVSIRLEKNIPIGAGLGGGSSDAAAVLVGLNSIFGSQVSKAELTEWAVKLGADVPFFVYGRPAVARGIGEILEEFPRRLPYHVVVAYSGASLSTRAVFAAYDAALTRTEPASRITVFSQFKAPLDELLVSDLEAVASRIHPGLISLKERLREMGAVGTLMTGSGSAVFGLWEEREQAGRAARELEREGVWARATTILDRTMVVEGRVAD
jgi:4-diphosphocytidyl-2-C-methyl-D-erythritol kinase